MKIPRFTSGLALLAALFGCAAAFAADGWETLFDGKTLAGWKASEHPGSITVTDGMIYCNGPRAHLFYVGADGKAEFENFELELEVKAMPGANSGVYFHVMWEDEGWPRKAGIEVQVNNDQPAFGNNYIENKKTGSLYGFRNLYKAMTKDGEWFTMNIRVAKPRVQVRINGKLMVDYIEPSNVPVLTPGATRDILTKGTFALQCHDEKSQAWYRHIRVRRLPPGEDASVVKPVYNEQDRARQVLARDNFPLVDLRTHVEGGPTLEELRLIHGRTGIFAGRVYHWGSRNEATDDAAAGRIVAQMASEPAFTGLEVFGADFQSTPRLETLAKFDYVVAHYAILGWGSDMIVEPGHEKEQQRGFEESNMDNLVKGRVRTMAELPVDVLADPLQLPIEYAGRAAELWTEERMRVLIDAAVKYGVALEISPHARQPSEKFVALAKAAGAKFTVGDNGSNAQDFTDWSYVLELQQKLKLTWRDMYVPGHDPTRSQQALAGK